MPSEVELAALLAQADKQDVVPKIDPDTKLTDFLGNTLDVVFHVGILYTALVVLLQFIIAPLYTETLTDNVTDSLESAMDANLTLDPTQQQALQIAAPGLQVVYRLTNRPAPEVTMNNNWLFSYAHSISVAIFLLFGVIVWVFFRLLKSATAGRPTLKVLRSNLLLIFPAILIAEYAFFKMIAVNMPPMLPSDVIRMIQEILEQRKTLAA